MAITFREIGRSRKKELEFSSSGADWIALWDGEVIAEEPIRKGQTRPPKSFIHIAKQYIEDTKGIKLKRLV